MVKPVASQSGKPQSAKPPAVRPPSKPPAKAAPQATGASRKIARSSTAGWTNITRMWVVPIVLIMGITLGAYLLMRMVDSDFKLAPFIQGLFPNKPESIEAAVGNIAQVIVGVLGLVITVVAIVVQLAAQRYTPKLVDLFVTDRINIGYFLFMVVTSIYTMLLNYSAKDATLPYFSGITLLVMCVTCMALLIPYFNYVFVFLTPGNIITIIRKNAKRAMDRSTTSVRPEALRKLQTDVANSMEQISDISLSAVSQMDRNVALLSIRSLKDVMVDHLLIKRNMPKGWFMPQKEHFPAISSDFLQEIARTRTWVEVKGFMDLELIFKMAIKEMPDGVSAIANSAKMIGLYAIKLRDYQVLYNVIQFFNTFLRHAVNDRNPKAIYNLFYQYRMLAEEVLTVDQKLAERITFYFKYYGQIAQNYEIPLILITAAFDLAYLLEQAYDRKVPNFDNLMKTFLEVDDNPATQSHEFDLRSVRKAQMMFASFLLSRGDTVQVRRIFEDLKAEPKARMMAIKAEMMSVKDRKFWEVTDRGVDFFYLDDTQKKHLEEFYAKFVDPHFAAQEAKGQLPPAAAVRA